MERSLELEPDVTGRINMSTENVLVFLLRRERSLTAVGDIDAPGL